MLGAEQLPDDHSGAVVTLPPDLSADLARVGSKPNDAVIDAALRLVTALAGSTVEGADGVSVTLERRGQLATVASSNDTVLRMDDHQYATGEGPCLAAAAQGRWFYIESLAEEVRWPAFVPRALEEGIASILSTPLMSAERSVGALNIYSNSERAFGPRQQELAALFASQASGILIDAGADVIDEELGKRILDGLLAREVIARAEGVLMARKHVTAEDAAAVLHRSARTAAEAVLQHAAPHDLLARRNNLDAPAAIDERLARPVTTAPPSPTGCASADAGDSRLTRRFGTPALTVHDLCEHAVLIDPRPTDVGRVEGLKRSVITRRRILPDNQKEPTLVVGHGRGRKLPNIAIDKLDLNHSLFRHHTGGVDPPSPNTILMSAAPS